MLSLDDPEWREMRHAHGSAENIPGLLKQVVDDTGPKVSYRDEPWYSLWSCLCHQGEVYDPSFAAMPHLIEALESSTPPVAWDFFSLPAAIECGRVRGEVEIPMELERDYYASLDALLPAAARLAAEPWDHIGVQSVAAAIAAANGVIDLAEVFLDMGPETTERYLIREGLR